MACQLPGSLECILFLYTFSYLLERIHSPLRPAEHKFVPELLLCSWYHPFRVGATELYVTHILSFKQMSLCFQMDGILSFELCYWVKPKMLFPKEHTSQFTFSISFSSHNKGLLNFTSI